jgi:opacity protein-like surface antigen
VKAFFVLMMASGMVSAQNSDLGLLIGISGPSSQVVTGTQLRVSGSVGASGQINYAMQLKESSTGRLYLELPLLIGSRASGTVASVITGSTVTGIYFTPGVRFNLTLHPRTSFYVTGGAGLAAFDQNRAIIGKGIISATSGWTSSFAVAFGGGLDFRLTRLISLRGEVRDFVSRKGIGLTDGRNHPVFGFGMGFHW